MPTLVRWTHKEATVDISRALLTQSPDVVKYLLMKSARPSLEEFANIFGINAVHGVDSIVVDRDRALAFLGIEDEYGVTKKVLEAARERAGLKLDVYKMEVEVHEIYRREIEVVAGDPKEAQRVANVAARYADDVGDEELDHTAYASHVISVVGAPRPRQRG